MKKKRPWFESSHQQNFKYNMFLHVNCLKAANKEIEAANTHFKRRKKLHFLDAVYGVGRISWEYLVSQVAVTK